MLGKKKIDFMGAELTRSEIDSYRAWLAMEEAKIHDRVVSAMIDIAEKNAMKNPAQGQDPHFFNMSREQNLGERKSLIRIKNMIQTLDEI